MNSLLKEEEEEANSEGRTTVCRGVRKLDGKIVAIRHTAVQKYEIPNRSGGLTIEITADDGRWLQYFIREAQILRSVHHENIIKLLDIVVEDVFQQHLYFVMEYGEQVCP